jgi:hypothetical protein
MFLKRKKKIRILMDGPLRGGDFVLNRDGGAATLSRSENFGLAVGHIAPKIGDSIFGFSEADSISFSRFHATFCISIQTPLEDFHITPHPSND